MINFMKIPAVNKKLNASLEKLRLRDKLQLIYILCVLIPLILTNGVIAYVTIQQERASRQHEMENIISAVEYNLEGAFERAASTGESIYTDSHVQSFLNEQYASGYDYLVAYQEILRNSYLEKSIGFDLSKITIYADNDTIVDGGKFGQLDKVRDTEWYRALMESEKNYMAYFYYDAELAPAVESKRKFLLIRKISRGTEASCEKVAKLEVDYNRAVRDILSMNYDYPVYVCKGDLVVLSNESNNNAGEPFETFGRFDDIAYAQEVNLYGETVNIYILKTKINFLDVVARHIGFILALILISLILPLNAVRQIERSITRRILKLEEVFNSVDSEELKLIDTIDGDDEIAGMMNNYNVMASRTNDLINTVYKDKLRQQESDLARQNAELHALHSQINPHFMFNALESIRMHSLLKKENETAEMVERLALMERQYTNWGDDQIPVSKELDFVRAYLELQKYRFGDKLSYVIDVEDECLGSYVPKLTLVTFVENACVHGIESKTSDGWIFLRGCMGAEGLVLEIEDTGKGLTEEEVLQLQEKMEQVTMESIRDATHVGILNACLRLKMVYGDGVRFEVDSEEGIGTLVRIVIAR